MKQKKFSYIIVSPPQIAGGPIVLHVLCRELRKQGYNAKIFYKRGYTNLKNGKRKFIISYLKFLIKDLIKNLLIPFNFLFEDSNLLNGYAYKPVKGTKRKFTPFFNKKNTIVIYPEIEYGNFLKAKNVVRWFLYHNKYKNDLSAFGKNDLFFSYREVFNDFSLNPKCKILHLNNFDWDTYKRTNFGKRKGTCYIVRKGAKRPDLPKTFDGVIIDKLPEKEKVKNFNKCEYCISYDTQTFYTTIASFCGCKTIIIPEENKSRKDYISSSEEKYGVAYGYSKEELDYAENTKEKLIKKIKKIDIDNEKNVKYFLEETHSYFK